MTRTTRGDLVRLSSLFDREGYSPLTPEELAKKSEAFQRGYRSVRRSPESDQRQEPEQGTGELV